MLNKVRPFESNLKSMIRWHQKHSYDYWAPCYETEFDHWQLNEFESLDCFNLDHTITKTLYRKCGAVHDCKAYLERCYLRESRVLFDHLSSETERLWLYETYEQVLDSDIAHMTLTQALRSKDKKFIFPNTEGTDIANA